MLQEWIRNGTLKEGTLLPSERQLASELGVGLATIQRAVRVLEEEGMVDNRGKRMRVIVNRQAPSFLSGTIAVVATPETPVTMPPKIAAGAPQPGYLRYIGHGAIGAVRAAGYHTMVLHPHKFGREQLDQFLLQRPLGVVLPELHYDVSIFPEFVAAFRRAGVPFVLGGSYDGVAECDRVISDHEQGEYEVTRWLLQQGHRRILCVLPVLRFPWILEREAGYIRAMREAGVEPLPTFWDEMSPVGLPDVQADFRVRSQYFAGCLAPFFVPQRSVDAIVATNDSQALEIKAACRALGVAQGFPVAGYDNFYGEIARVHPEFCPEPPVVTIDKRNYELGEELVRLLLERVENKLPAEPQVRKLAPVLIPIQP
ncbi:DNA-binding transcriptional regulator, LacI/PurR family [Verrucomicrobium sp. GAS474]|uniref:LacI family DNA-binding transcriptional regulator n=1 Tax=Verrucomicrobium sp. GAS474 TaxID=1882831 RepID=UPI00087AE75F|nr:GntR family transcriptional regulator [Verrucomicrobium sp. GAS474]SDT94104.1 DNA-binding transcriptional regulator, LacI/PurR family [Verrucomicrobium sp. GAS474]